MSFIKGIKIIISTSEILNYQKNMRLYLGVFGKNGGREFPLMTENSDVFSSNSTIALVLGEIPSEIPPPLYPQKPLNTEPGQKSDPALYPIDFDNLEFVYVRLEESQQQQSCRFWSWWRNNETSQPMEVFLKIDELSLYDADKLKGRFKSPEGTWLGPTLGEKMFLKQLEII